MRPPKDRPRALSRIFTVFWGSIFEKLKHIWVLDWKTLCLKRNSLYLKSLCPLCYFPLFFHLYCHQVPQKVEICKYERVLIYVDRYRPVSNNHMQWYEDYHQFLQHLTLNRCKSMQNFITITIMYISFLSEVERTGNLESHVLFFLYICM